jgi:MFS transporter, ACS family, hexuronate transporter
MIRYHLLCLQWKDTKEADDFELNPDEAGLLMSSVAAPRKIRGLRWRILALIFLATTINYIDRQSISLLFPIISRPEQLNISAIQYSRVASILLVAYMLSQSLSGKFFDRFGARVGFTVSIVVWSFAAMGHALITGFYSFAAMSFALGFGEAGNWPGSAKVIAEWFPVRERALGMACFNSGVAMGSIIAPPLVIALQFRFGWRETFVLVGLLGFPWLLAWLAFYRPVTEHPRLSDEERSLILENRQVVAGPAVSLRTLLKYRQVWAVVLARFFGDPIMWLFVFWLPEYLIRARGLSLKQVGLSAWVPYVAASAGSLFGGWLSGHLIKGGMSVNAARKTVIAIAACMTPAGLLAARAESTLLALAFISVVLFSFQMWVGNVQTLPSDFFPERMVGSVAGLGGTGAAMGSMVLMLATGWVVTHFSYAPILTVAGVLAPVGTIVLFLLAGRIERLPLDQLPIPAAHVGLASGNAKV